MMHHVNSSGTAAAVWDVFGWEIRLGAPWPWLAATASFGLGILGLTRCVPELREAWDSANLLDSRS
jgi:hypothetical protein